MVAAKAETRDCFSEPLLQINILSRQVSSKNTIHEHTTTTDTYPKVPLKPWELLLYIALIFSSQSYKVVSAILSQLFTNSMNLDRKKAQDFSAMLLL